MNAIEALYRSAGLVTEDDYVKVRDGLWIASDIYTFKSWFRARRNEYLPSKDELNEIYLKLQELILIQKACYLPCLDVILKDKYPSVWSSTEYGSVSAWFQNMKDGSVDNFNKDHLHWVIPVRRTP